MNEFLYRYTCPKFGAEMKPFVDPKKPWKIRCVGCLAWIDDIRLGEPVKPVYEPPDGCMTVWFEQEPTNANARILS